MSLTQAYRPDPRILELGEAFFDPVEPARFPSARARFLNRRAAEPLGLADMDWEAHLHRFEPLPDNLPQPLALRYHGHQFRSYNPELGDGRGFLFAQLRGADGRLLDLGTKGSGQTPWSRFGDGRLTLKGAVREVLATEMLEALGVGTSKTFAVFETGEDLVRNDEPSPTRSAVLTRLSHGHIRIGTFQRLAYHDDAENMARLVRYCLQHLYGDDPEAGAVQLFDRVSQATATLAASYMAAGFVHGVLNTDNINITGESFDYGPWRFTPDWDPSFTAAYFDQTGLYAFGRQPEAVQWNLAQLAGCLTYVADAAEISELLQGWADRFQAALIDGLLKRLGIAHLDADSDRALARATVTALAGKTVEIDRFFFDWRGGRVPADPRYDDPVFHDLRQLLAGRERLPTHPYWSDPQPCSMHIEEVEAIWAPIAQGDDWTAFDAKVAAIRRMGDAMRDGAPA
ncbi:YdiU family protein [Sphingomonas sp. BN140010]|uniref:Protein nucleotidyltransferase YdiU n=1 Tax=Sphingomonas arvum TaxID=2992113 RepID=A0ABT3JCG7_9SPHN|nr:YdiU family protein [Sphingomonas sp. BN140010]MCW3796760.1 YdiU family protein [Sphingomonas sp. BN140010]